ncbi:E3 ubiquitin-protein ligase TRIM39-like isoform X2 [Tachyglossus aculeatus]|nr:E3 ubiquitin-protein ligase TRIM39-like isoform X2 [Tachyglossus aculeatus]
MAQSFHEEVTCPICLDYFNYPMSLGCGHTFCFHCIVHWASGTERSCFSCPECRRISHRRDVWPNKQLGILAELVKQHSPILVQTLSMEDDIHRITDDLTLDPDTAHPFLDVSKDRRSVKCGDVLRDVPKHPGRFDEAHLVLASKSFSSGTHYWEVEVAGKTGWILGVCKESLSRKGNIRLSPKCGYWTIFLERGNQFQAGASPEISLSLGTSPCRVGVFLDVENGSISFYNVTGKLHIYSFTRVTFSEPVRPVFGPGGPDGGGNVAPLTICPLVPRSR